ncbi:hypothetical protein [Actinoplanes sp. NPDC049265]|uniref:hypothetical protein n=1 Tax=Actinoplanes sp. NPDC049265 TaxID=3363902 RepID=UPI00372002AB
MTNENPETIQLGEALLGAEQQPKNRRRRLIAQTAGGALLGAAVISGAFALPHAFSAKSSDTSAGVGGTAVVQPGAAPAASASPLSPTELNKKLIEAGKLPPAGDDAHPNAGPGISKAEEKALDKYFAAGYELGEARKLQKIWKMEDKELLQVKSIAGQKLLDGKKLPIKPGNTAPPQTSAEQKQVDAFFKKGYDYDDAAQLAKLWKLESPYDGKVAGGKKILAGETLPIKP